MLAVLKEFGSCDWQLASLVCQVLWNYVSGSNDPSGGLSDEVTKDLLNVLEDYLGKSVTYRVSFIERR